MQFWILTPSVHVLDIREGFRHIPDYACLNELVSSRVRLDTILRAGKHAFYETFQRPHQNDARRRYCILNVRARTQGPLGGPATAPLTHVPSSTCSHGVPMGVPHVWQCGTYTMVRYGFIYGPVSRKAVGESGTLYRVPRRPVHPPNDSLLGIIYRCLAGACACRPPRALNTSTDGVQP